MKKYRLMPLLFALCLFTAISCASGRNTGRSLAEINAEPAIPDDTDYTLKTTDALYSARLPENITENINNSLSHDNAFITEILYIIKTDPYLWILVDKEHPLDKNYEPEDLVELNSGFYRLNKNLLLLRVSAASALEEMARAARNSGINLLISSTYRSYEYQAGVYAQNIRAYGINGADRISARPGYSQHQLGLTVDFGSISGAFTNTAESKWLKANASLFGWSLSYPEGFERVTGYSYESWHYRYVGKELAQFINKYFNGIQHYALVFIHEFTK